MSPFQIPVRRPVATSMFFAALVLIGLIGWRQIPVELLPPLGGNSLNVTFVRPGSEPETVERELLVPLESRALEMPGVEETSGFIRASGGQFTVSFEPGVDMKVRELELGRIAAELARRQPAGTTVDVQAADLSAASRFVMVIQLTGRDDLNVLRHLADDQILQRIASVNGVSNVFVFGGAPREVTVRVDPDRCAALGVQPDAVTAAVARAAGRFRFLGGVEDDAGRAAVLLDGRTEGLLSLGQTRLALDRPVLLRHVADIDMGTGRVDSIQRVNGQRTLGLVVFQEENANVVRLGRGVRARLVELEREYAAEGIGFSINIDGAQLVEDQLDRLKTLAGSGFLIALVVLYLFLRQWRAVGVVAVAVPVSLLSALALLYLFGQSLNLITLFGLAVGIGMLVDNSIVVYEAVQRQLERGAEPDHAAEHGVRRTVRAILAASATNAIVFLPITFFEFDQAIYREFLEVLALAILLPLVGSLAVAVGLVPLLARHLSAPAALARIRRERARRQKLAGLSPPDRPRELFSGLLTVALRRPAVGLTVVTAAVVVTVVVALPWVAFTTVTSEPPEAEQVTLAVDLPPGASLDHAASIFDRLEAPLLELDGVEQVDSLIQEQNGSLTVHLLPEGERPKGVNAGRVRSVVKNAVEQAGPGVQLRRPGEGSPDGGGSSDSDVNTLLGRGPSQVVLSGPESRTLSRLADEIEERLESIPEISDAWKGSRTGQEELQVTPVASSLAAFGLTADQVLPALGVVRREGVNMQVGYTNHLGREIPLRVTRDRFASRAIDDLRGLRLSTSAGVIPLGAVANVRKMPPPPAILHKNGRREISIYYRFGPQAPQTGPARQALEDRIARTLQTVHRPPGYTLEPQSAVEGFDWFKRILVPVVLLLLAVLAITFESVTLPILVLLALPLTALGATWALVVTGTPADSMALVGVIALIGLTVNPAILLVDRMQQKVRRGTSSGAAALGAVRERARPVLMTAATTIAGLWPLALVTGRDNEIWPPFATVVMGGLVTSTALTLLVIPIGFVLLSKLDRVFGRLGPWVLIGWVLATALVMTPLIWFGAITSMTWKIVTTGLVAATWLGVAVLIFRREKPAVPEAKDGPPVLDIRYLRKVYGKPGPVLSAWRLPELFARRVLARGGRPFDPADAWAGLGPRSLLVAASTYLVLTVDSGFWKLAFLFAGVLVSVSLVHELRRWRGKVDERGQVLGGGPESAVATLLPWLAVLWIVLWGHVIPRIAGEVPDYRRWLAITLPLVVLTVQAGRHTARRLARGEIREVELTGRLARARTVWRGVSRRLFGLDLPREEVDALSRFHFRAERGMIGILGPNGAGKTTLLRQLAGILEPSVGTIHLGGVRLEEIRRHLARYVGYLPQEFGLPGGMTAREYLSYYALLYEIRPAERRVERVDRLLTEVGLGERANERIASYSGGMRQRVAVARTLLRLPPVIIVDEPTVGLDPRERIRFRNLLSRLAEGRIVLFSTHVVEDVSVACERVIVLRKGRMVFDGEPQGLASHAEGKVWKVRLTPDREAEIDAAAKIVDHVPEADGTVRMRVLCERRPHPDAETQAPSLEDGYLLLTGAPVEEVKKEAW